MTKNDIAIAEMAKDIKTLLGSVDDLKSAFEKSCDRQRDMEGKVTICETNLTTAGQEINRLRSTQNTYSLLNVFGAAIMSAIAGIVGYLK